jgi:hypothetical protein
MIVVAVFLVVLHTLDGRDIIINPAQVTSMREAHDDDADHKAFTGGVRCMINTTDGKFVTVIEECETVRKMVEDKHGL